MLNIKKIVFIIMIIIVFIYSVESIASNQIHEEDYNHSTKNNITNSTNINTENNLNQNMDSKLKKNDNSIETEKIYIEEGTYIIRSALNKDYVIDVSGGSINNYANIQLYISNNTDAQKFIVKKIDDTYYEIKSIKSGKVLDVSNGGKTPGTNVWQYEINETDAQRWIIKKNNDLTYSIVSKLNNLYLDVSEGKIRNEQNIQVYTENGTKAQRFIFEKVNSNTDENDSIENNIINHNLIEDGMYTIKSKLDEKYVLDISGGSKEICANIQLYIENKTNAQKFYIKYLGDGDYEIKSIKSNNVLDVENGKNVPETNIWQYQPNGTDAQKWKIKRNTDNSYSIISKLNGLCIDVQNGQAKNEQNIQLYTGNGTNAQKFIFEKTEKNMTESDYLPENAGKRTIENGIYIINTAINDEFVLDVSEGTNSNGGNIQLYTLNMSNAQKFNIRYLNYGYYEIESINSKKLLTVKELDYQSGTNVYQWEKMGSDTQKWLITDKGDGNYSIVSKYNRLNVDVKDGLARDYSNIQMWKDNNTLAQKFKFKDIKKIHYSVGTYGESGLKKRRDFKGSELKYFKIGHGKNVFFATFAVHGWEDNFAYDGQELTKIANSFRDKLSIMNDNYIESKWTIYIFPSLNPDGEYFGWTHNGPGRTTLYSDAPEHKGIDMNRAWSTDWVKYTTDRNYTGTEPFQAYESRCLRDFLLSHKSSTGQTVLVDLHGWLNETMGDDEIGGYYRSQLGMSKHISAYGRGYLINWARANLGSNGKTARSALIELPEANSSQDVNNLELSDKYINATINMLRNI